MGNYNKDAPKLPTPPIGNVSPIKPPPADSSFKAFEDKYKKAVVKLEKMASVKQICDRITLHKDIYEKVEAKTGVPWFVVACISSLESGLDLKACLHNGERIIGTGRKTTLVPKGKGPFETWEEAAIDALGKHSASGWSIGYCLDFLEKYNGLGYRRRGIPSPYVWSFTDQYTKGKYVADGVFNPDAVSGQCGAAAIMKGLGI